MSDVDHKQEAEDWLQSAEAEAEYRGYHDPFPHEFVQSAALMSIAHSLVAILSPRTEGDWEPTRWWRAIGSDGAPWSESSDEQEIRDSARRGDRIQRLFQAPATSRWEDQP